MYEEPLLPLKTILFNLKCFAENVRKDEDFCENVASQLRDNDYDVKEDAGAKIVMKVLALAVNEALQDKVKLSQINDQNCEEGLKLKQLLEIPSSKSLHDYFVNPAKLERAESPLHMARNLWNDVPQWFIRNIIQHHMVHAY